VFISRIQFLKDALFGAGRTHQAIEPAGKPDGVKLESTQFGKSVLNKPSGKLSWKIRTGILCLRIAGAALPDTL